MSDERRRGSLGLVLLITGIALVLAGLFFKASGLEGAFCGGFLAAISSGCVELNDIANWGYVPAVVLLIGGLLLVGTSLKWLR